MRDVFNSLTSMPSVFELRNLANSALMLIMTYEQTELEKAIKMREKESDQEVIHMLDMVIARHRAALLQAKLELKSRR